jgi:hydroxycarboxylate dehydrogenase B
MLCILIDPQRLGTQNAFTSEALAFADWVRQAPLTPGSDGVMLAGEPERKARIERTRDGIVIDKQTWADIAAAAQSVGVAAP